MILTPENMIGTFHLNCGVKSEPWTGAAPRVPKLLIAKAKPILALRINSIEVGEITLTTCHAYPVSLG